ncbi:MAG: hypothetical protein AAFO07_23275 [Bacteroidota bacterium]
MIDRFLNAKHWQIFILIFGIPFLAQMLSLSAVTYTIAINENTDKAIGLFSFFPFLIVLSIVFYFAWFFSIGVGLQKSIPSHINLNVKRFKIFLLFPAIYMFLLMLFMYYMFTNMTVTAMNTFALVFIIPMHLFAIFCMFYCMYFVAKTYKTAELQREVSFGDFVGEFFLIWFYPIGVWFLQPKINELNSNSELV